MIIEELAEGQRYQMQEKHEAARFWM